MPRPGHDLMTGIWIDRLVRMEDLPILIAGDFQNARQTFFSTRQRVVDKDVVAGYVGLELHHGGATRRHKRRLDVGQRRAGQGALVVDLVKDLADDVEAGGQVGAAYTEEDPDGFTHFRLQLV